MLMIWFEGIQNENIVAQFAHKKLAQQKHSLVFSHSLPNFFERYQKCIMGVYSCWFGITATYWPGV